MGGVPVPNEAEPRNPRAKLTCPVRGCGEPLRWEVRHASCIRGHLFDRAKSGYCNLLQVQDRKSKNPGDSKEAVLARRRSLERGLGVPLRDALFARIGALKLAPESVVLDAGCGEGYYLAALCERFGFEGWGVDISTPAVEAAAKAHPNAWWIVANADRPLPFADGAFQLITSITARKNPAEYRRLLAPGGRVLVVVADEDDQAELRGELFGEVLAPDRAGATVTAFAEWFELEDETVVRSRVKLDSAGLKDLLLGSYRGERHSSRERLNELTSLEVTLSFRILCFKPLPDLLSNSKLRTQNSKQ